MSASSALSADWSGALEGEFADAFCCAIRQLPLDRLQRFPPPKVGGLPLGHELRIARRFLVGGSSLLDPSAFSAAYRSLAPKTQQTLYRGLILGEPLAAGQWRSLLGSEETERWTDRGLLRAGRDDQLRCCFRVIALGPLRFVVDHFDDSITQRVHIGQDSLNMVEFLARRLAGNRGPMLDVGTGSGLQLLTAGQGRESALGVDINPRAVRIAQLNVRLNQASHCTVELRDAFDSQWRPRPFQLVTWNLPFMFFPESEVSNNLDGHGGHLGIALTLSFVERLVELLHPQGDGWLLSSAPLMLDGRNGLEEELRDRAARFRLDISTFVLQKYWDRRHIQFHRSHSIKCFESVMVRIRHGSGQFTRTPPGTVRRCVDWLRTRLHERH